MIFGRLFNYGIGIHLLQSDDPEGMPKNVHINPKDNHISFQVYFSFSICVKLNHFNLIKSMYRVSIVIHICLYSSN